MPGVFNIKFLEWLNNKIQCHAVIISNNNNNYSKVVIKWKVYASWLRYHFSRAV